MVQGGSGAINRHSFHVLARAASGHQELYLVEWAVRLRESQPLLGGSECRPRPHRPSCIWDSNSHMPSGALWSLKLVEVGDVVGTLP